jgi:hypothetical protein
MKTKHFEIDTTEQVFAIGFAWSGAFKTGRSRFFAIIVGPLVFRFNWNHNTV